VGNRRGDPLRLRAFAPRRLWTGAILRIHVPTIGNTTPETAFLFRPSYAEGVLVNREPSRLRAEFERVRHNFDSKAFVTRCGRTGCGRTASIAMAFSGSAEVLFFCVGCAPDPLLGRQRGGLSDVSSFDAAMNHVNQTCGKTKAGIKSKLVRELARAKGIGSRLTEYVVWKFLSLPIAGEPYLPMRPDGPHPYVRRR
jgi:hypothetical protein